MRKIINFFDNIHIFFIIQVNRIRFFKKVWKCYSYPFDIYNSVFDMNMEMFKHFFENSDLDDNIAWQYDTKHMKVRFIMGEIYDYYFERINLKSDHDRLISIPCDNKRKDGRSIWDKNTKEEDEMYRISFEIDDYLLKRDEEVMIQLMKIRKYLWV